MGFSDDLAAETKATSKCKIESVRARMDTVDRKVLDAAMDNREKIPTDVIIRAINKDPENVHVGRKAVMKHRDHLCSCFFNGGEML